MELYAYAQSLADDRRARPMDDIVTTLVTAELDGEKLSDIEFNVFVLLLSVAGNETTRNLISGGMLALMQNPDQQERLVADLDGLLPTAVDEMLRYVSPVQYFRRTATADAEIRGVPIAAGDKVTIWYGAANRDEEVFDGSAGVRRRAHAERAPRVRRARSALLSRREPGEDGDPRDVRGDPRPAARHEAGGGAGAAAVERSSPASSTCRSTFTPEVADRAPRRRVIAEEQARRARELVLRVVRVLATGRERDDRREADVLEHLGDGLALADLVVAERRVDPAGHEQVEVALRVERAALDGEDRLDDRRAQARPGAGDVDDPPERRGDPVGGVAVAGRVVGEGLRERRCPRPGAPR